LRDGAVVDKSLCTCSSIGIGKEIVSKEFQQLGGQGGLVGREFSPLSSSLSLWEPFGTILLVINQA